MDIAPKSWGSAAEDYASYRDIYPSDFFRILREMGVGTPGTKVLDVGTGTGPIPRAMAKYGADWTGADVSEAQIHQARRLDAVGNITWLTASAEHLPIPANTFDTVIACQCIWYFDAPLAAAEIARILRPSGTFVVAYLGWLPEESEIARASENLVLKYNPEWTGSGDRIQDIVIPSAYDTFFDRLPQRHATFSLPFTRDSWHGRFRACRGTRLEMPPEQFERWSLEHRQMLETVAPNSFSIPHYAAFAQLLKTPS